MNHDIFISYATEDRDRARQFTDAFKQQGYAVWWDQEIPAGKTWDEVISKALDGAKCVVVLWSAHSVNSRWVKEEAERAANRGHLLPVLLDSVSPPLGFGRIQAADLSNWRGNASDPLFIQFLASVQGVVATGPLPQSLPTPKKPLLARVFSNVCWLFVASLGLLVGTTVLLNIVSPDFRNWFNDTIGAHPDGPSSLDEQLSAEYQPLNNCTVTITRSVDLEVAPYPLGTPLLRIPQGQYESTKYAEIQWAGSPMGFFQISVEGRAGWVRNDTFHISEKTAGCP